MNTPETDKAAQFCYGHIDRKWCSVTFTRDMERQRDEARKKLSEERTVADHLAAALRGEYSKWEALKAWESRLEKPPSPVSLQNDKGHRPDDETT